MTRRWLMAALLMLAAAVPHAAAKDLSAETIAIVHDLLAPYRGTAAPDAVVQQALDILKKEKLLDTPRPATRPLGVAEKLGRALALGTRTGKFLAEVAAVRDAIVQQNDASARAAIQSLYVKLGRKAPDGVALDGLLRAARDVVGAEPQETERVTLEGPGYTVLVEYARSAGKARISVLNNKGPDGKPARVEFKGDVGTRPDAAARDLQTVVAPAAAPDVMTSAQAAELRARLNGRWFDQSGAEYEITGESGAIVITELRPGKKNRPYAGTFDLGLIRAAFPITHVDDMGESLPLNVRSQLAGMGLKFGISLSVLDKGARLDGTWSSQNVTYSPGGAVSKVHDPYDVALTLSQRTKDYRVVKLDISYRGWERKKLELQSSVTLAQHDLEREKAEAQRLYAELDKRRAAAATAHRAFIGAEARYGEAVQRLNNYVPADAGKSAAYRRLEQRRSGLTRRVDTLYEAIIANRGNMISPQAFETYDRLVAELARVEAELAGLDKTLGFVAERERLTQAARDAFDARSRADIELDNAVVVQDLAHGRIDQAEQRLTEAQAKLDAAELKLARFNAETFRVDGVEAEEGAVMRYQVEAWDPSEVLAFLDREIAQLAAVLAQASEIRRNTRAEFLAAQNEASEAQLRLASGIMSSAVAQGIAETAFNAVDVVEKTVEAGPIGALGEGAKKVVEAVVLGPPGFYEPSLAPEIMTGDGGPFSDIRGSLNDAFEYSRKRAKKSGISSPTASYIINRYLAARDTRVYMQLIDQAIQGSMQTGYHVVGETQGQAAAKAFDAMQKARAGLKKAVDQGLLRNLAGLTRLSFKEAFKKVATSPQAGKLAHSVGRDLAKMATKKVLAEWLEGVPLAEYLAAEGEARLRTQIFLAASSVYWDAKDDHQARADERREILRQYDARNHMRIVKDERFPEGADLLLVLRDAAGRPISAAGHAVTLTLGGKPAQRLEGDQLFFRIAASDLAHDGKGGVTLGISVGE